MFDDNCRGQMVVRLRALRPDAVRRWGKMSAPQMVAHLTDQMHHALGDSPIVARRGILRWAPVRFAAIYLVRWPKGRIQGPPEAFLTPPGEWEADVSGLEALLKRFVERGEEAAWPDHALFGRMTGTDWGVFVHKHFDHHFRQFGG